MKYLKRSSHTAIAVTPSTLRQRMRRRLLRLYELLIIFSTFFREQKVCNLSPDYRLRILWRRHEPDAEQQPDETLNGVMTIFKKTNTLQGMDAAHQTLLYSASYQTLKQPSSPIRHRPEQDRRRKAYPHLPAICKGTENPTHNHYRKTMAGGT